MLSIRQYISSRIHSVLKNSLQYNATRHERTVVMQGLMLSKMNEGKLLNSLNDAEWSGFSQWGEDGIIDWLVGKLPNIPKTFIEFGVEDYLESNTRMLVYLRNWHGLIMDGSTSHISKIQSQEIYWRHQITAKCAFIDKDNINKLILNTNLNGDIGLLSVDIDGNDYWVWQAIDAVSPVIVVCEYNAVFGDLLKLSVPYNKDFQRTRAHHSNIYFGASLPAFIELAQQKNYSFIGTTSTGCNAFFIRNDYAPIIFDSLKNISAFPSSVRESRSELGQLTYACGTNRLSLIRDLPLVNLDQKEITTLDGCGEVYSNNWKTNQPVVSQVKISNFTNSAS